MRICRVLFIAIAIISGSGCYPGHSIPYPYPYPRPNPRPTPPPTPVPTPPPAPAPKAQYKPLHHPAVVATDCPVAGSGNTAKTKGANRFKNRTKEPSGYIFIPIDSILEAGRDAYSQDQGIYTEGYIAELKHGSAESCNCDSKTDLDVHIGLVPTLDDLLDKKRKMIVEVTPRLQINMSWADLKRLKANQTKIRVFGWLFFDVEHVGATWRGTEWEIHPVTDIEEVEE